jgi:hypothetical protein
MLMKKIFILFALFLITSYTKSQTTYLMSSVNVTLTCPSTSLFYDSGGSAANYGNSQNLTKTFFVPAGSCLSISFSSSYTTEACCDRLRIYDGPSGASPLIGTYSGGASPGVVISTGSALTFSWTSDGSVNRAGWDATITCAPGCSGTPAGGTATNLAPTCPPAGSVGLSVTGTAASGCGLTFQWQSGPSSTGPWSSVVGATTAVISVPVSAGTFYRRITTCAPNSGTSTAQAAVSYSGTTCNMSYTAASTTYSFHTFTGNVLPTTDDVLFTSIVTFGFPFCFDGGTYWGGFVASNAAFVFDAIPCNPNVAFSTYAAGGVGTGYTIPNPAPVNATSIPRNAVLAPWHDIHPGLGGTIQYTTTGTAPNRVFTVSWENVPMFSCGTASPAIYHSSQVRLFETSNAIEIHVRNKGVCPTFNNGEAVLGLHNFNGTIYRPPVNMTAHNAVGGAGPYNQWSMTNTGYRYTTTCGSSGTCLVLPINFAKFYGERIEKSNHLYWETSEESNIKEFIVERALDAQTFIPIGTVSPYNKVNSKYQFEDKLSINGAVNYYRVTAIEKTGERKSTYVYPLGAMDGEVVVNAIYPNPVKNRFNLGFDSKINTQASILVYDAFGKVVKSFLQDINTGQVQLSLDVEELSSGIYLLEVTNSGKEVLSKQKLVKVD